MDECLKPLYRIFIIYALLFSPQHLLYSQNVMEIKSPSTITQQVELLKSRDLLIENEYEAKNFLKHVNYYTLSGYLYAFKEGENFKRGITMSKIEFIYQCDKRFKNIILYAIDEAEQNLKTKVPSAVGATEGTERIKCIGK